MVWKCLFYTNLTTNWLHIFFYICYIQYVHSKYKNIVQIVGVEICVYWTDVQNIYNIK